MTVFSAVTYSVAYSLEMHYDHNETLNISQFLYGWIFVLLCQLSAHFLGEYYDFKADQLNKQGSPFTGGSRVLVDGGYSSKRCLILGWSCCILSLATLSFVLPARVHLVGYCMVFLATQYSGVPFRFNHRALGEICAALVMNVLLPYFAAVLASTIIYERQSFPWNFYFFMPRLAMLVVPAAFVKFALFLVLNLADRRSDWLAGKITLPVVLGDKKTALWHAATMVLGYLSSIVIYFLRSPSDPVDIWTLLGVLLTAIPGLAISRDLLASDRPYHINHLVFRSLKHAPLPLVVIFIDCFVREIFAAPSILGHIFSLDFQLRCVVIYPYIYNVLLGKSPPPFILYPKLSQERALTEEDQVIIAGGGVSGLVLAACLQRLGIPCTIVEKKSQETHEDGADLGLWPSSIKILQALGIPDSFWRTKSYPVRRVYMTKLHDQSAQENKKEDVLKLVDMNQVVKGTGEHFRLIGRQELMDVLHGLVDPSRIMYSTKIENIEEDANGVTVHLESTVEKPKSKYSDYIIYNTNNATNNEDHKKVLRGRIVVGADGINSLCRNIIRSAKGHVDEASRYCGELCYRGVCDLKSNGEISKLFLENERKKPAAMTIFYGDGIRASWGLIDQTQSKGFWWIKVKSPTPEPNPNAPLSWPHPLNLLYHSTDHSSLYVHPILDRIPSNKWCNERVVLVGDAAHPVTPNMGQGANMSIEDVFVLSTLLSKYYHYDKDGHQEAFYQYFKTRHPHTTKIANESYQQSKIGQWTNPHLIKIRETMMRLIPASVLQKKLRNVNLFNVQPWIDAFKTQIDHK